MIRLRRRDWQGSTHIPRPELSERSRQSRGRTRATFRDTDFSERISGDGRGGAGSLWVSHRLRSLRCVRAVRDETRRPTDIANTLAEHHSGPASRLRISARNLAETHLSFAGIGPALVKGLSAVEWGRVRKVGEQKRSSLDSPLAQRNSIVPVKTRQARW